MVLPLIKTHFSPLRSLLTIEKEEKDVLPTGPQSIVLMWKKANPPGRLHLCEDTPTGFAEQYKTLSSLGIPFSFSLRLVVCEDMAIKNEESLKTEHKVIVLAKNSTGIADLNKIYTIAATEGFYYNPRIDLKRIEAMWTPNLKMIIPFYDSYLYNNVVSNGMCSFVTSIKPAAYLSEHNGIPTDTAMNAALSRRVDDAAIVKAQTIYYPEAKDFDAYLTMRIIDKKSSMDKPNLPDMCSDEFSFQKWTSTF